MELVGFGIVRIVLNCNKSVANFYPNSHMQSFSRSAQAPLIAAKNDALLVLERTQGGADERNSKIDPCTMNRTSPNLLEDKWQPTLDPT